MIRRPYVSDADVAEQALILTGRVLESLEHGTPTRYLAAVRELRAYVSEHATPGDPDAAEALAALDRLAVAVE